MDKSYVTIGICPICKGETGELLLDRRLKPTFDMRTIIPYSVCNNCRNTYLKAGVMLIDPKTGALAVVRNTAYRRLFHKTALPKNKIAYCTPEVLEKIEELQRLTQKAQTAS